MAGKSNTILYIDGVSVSFDGFRAINSLSLVLDKGEMRAIIGPNGAGKTTMMDIVTGKTRPDEGEVFFDGQVDLTKHDEAEIAMMGIGRKFQKPTVFENHTIEDNLMLALKGPRSIFPALFHRRSVAEARQTDDILGIIRLGDKRDDLAANLSHGQKQWLEIGMLLAQAWTCPEKVESFLLMKGDLDDETETVYGCVQGGGGWPCANERSDEAADRGGSWCWFLDADAMDGSAAGS
ncbi:ATP-binding cassette domain-containing protein [Mesorhizobium sp. PAMC28654]|uniref:ATP-binding cassette domain-containing protein n=1 Tax=Mesorhizobium sp. PAMC28654 TaxID=2880934 RepID=UPI0039B57127